MAITQLAQGVTTLQNSAAALSTAARSQVAGSNRMLLVAVATEAATVVTLPAIAATPVEFLPIVTWGTVPLSLLRRDGGNLASASVTDNAVLASFSIASRLSLHFFALREAEMAGLLNNQIVVAWPIPVAGAGLNFQASYWLLDDCDQSLIVRDFRTATANNLGPTSLGTTTNPGGTSDAVIVAGMKNESTGAIAMTIDGVGISEDFDTTFATSGARFAGGRDLSAGAIAGIPFSMAFSVQTNQGGLIITGVRLAEHFPPDGQVSLYDAPGSIVTLEAL